MAEYQKFLKIRFKIWWIIFICAQICLFILMSHSFAAETWVKSDSNALIINFQWDDYYNNIYIGGKFVGRLLYCKETCDESYKKLSKEWCDLYDDLDNDNLYSDDHVETYKSVCLLYRSLYIGACINLAFEIAAIISIILWGLGMLLYTKWKKWIWLSFISSGCTWLLHYIAFIGYIGVTNANFNGDCVDFPNDGSKPKLCAEQGPTIMLVVAILIPIICIFFCIVACNLHRNFGNKGFKKVKDRASLGEQTSNLRPQSIQEKEYEVRVDLEDNMASEYQKSPVESLYNIDSIMIEHPSCPDNPTDTVNLTGSQNLNKIEDHKPSKKHNKRSPEINLINNI